MSGQTFLASGDEQQYQNNYVAESTIGAGDREANGWDNWIVGDSSLRSCALDFARKGDFREAVSLFTQLIHRNPDSAIDYNNRGLVYFQCGETQKALEDYNTAIALKPTLASAYNNRGNYYAACGKLETAIDDYDEALDLNPSYTRAWINRGITLRDLGRYEEAIDNLEIALLFDRYEGHILAERGRTHHLAGDWNCAIADYRRATAILPASSQTQDGAGYRLRLQVENWLGDLLCS